ncbi:MAG: acetyl-CoA carboxylase biotin carboxyl carrier protein subunit, partial [Actinocrinis sp.]
AGHRVSAGEPLGTMEAMKMEHTLTAPHDGVVTRVGAEVGQKVSIGAELFVIETADGSDAGAAPSTALRTASSTTAGTPSNTSGSEGPS